MAMANITNSKTRSVIYFVIVFLFGSVQTVLGSTVTLSGILRFDGQSMSDITDVSPTFWYRNDETGQAVSGITSTYDNNTGVYSVSGLPPAQVGIKVTFHIRGVTAYLPGNYNVFEAVEIPSLSLAQRTNYNMDLQQTIHMTSPWDNDAIGPHTYPGDPYPEHNSRRLDFIWDTVPGATQYRIDIFIYRDPDHPDGYGRIGSVVNSYVQGTSFFASLDFSNEFQHYQASILAYGSGGNVLGHFEIAYENGHGWDYRFKVVESLPIAETSLVGWWKFDEGSGTTAIDSSGNGFDIPLHNTTWEDGIFGGALRFHGLGYGYVENFNYSDNAITVCAWVQHDAFRIGKIERYVTVAPEVAVIRKEANGSLHFYIKTDGNLRHLWVSDVLMEGLWHHVAGTWDGVTQRLYIDGVEIASQVPGGVLGNTSNVDMCSEGDESFNGMLDDVRIYNRALTQNEIQVITQGEEFQYASNPYPADGDVLADTNVTLSWEPGFGAILHYFYFGDDYDLVSNATDGMPWGASTYSPGTLDLEKTYYWRVDEVQVDGTIHTGDVWSFSILPEISITDPSLVGWWKFDETSRSPGSDSRGRGNDGILAYDSSGHGNDGILVGNPQWVAGKIGGALKFDGNGDYVDCGYDQNLNITNEVTVTAWIKLSATGFDQKVGSNQSGIAGGYKMTVYFNNKVEFEIRTSENTAILNRDVGGGTVLQQDVWYHVAGVYSQKGNYIRTYVDGNSDRELITTEVLGASPGPFMIGCEPFEPGFHDHHFNGIMDDIRIYNRTLTQNGIQVIMQGEEFPYAFSPDPADGAILADTNVILSWSSGSGAQLHIVYFGDNFEDVNNDPGGLLQETTTYTPGPLELDKVYYWRIDEFDGVIIHKGDVWSFTVADPLSEALDSGSHTLE
ncbi:MAG: LamG domain-containing protein [Planctomycetes bacterium]|nr:LamG domain-containing protein [Planctomycetota bacterium]